MKLLLISSSSGSHGGGEFYLLTLSKGLQASGHEVHVWMSDHPQMDPLADAIKVGATYVDRIQYVNTYHRPTRCFGAYLDRSTQRMLSTRIHSCNFDLIHINQQCLEDGLDLVVAASRCGLPAVSTVHITRSATRLGAHGGWFRDSLSRYALRRSQVPLIAISPTSTADLEQFMRAGQPGLAEKPTQNGVQKKPQIHCVSNGVSMPGLLSRDEARRVLGIAEGDFVLGVIARLEEQKNPLFMCRLLQGLPEYVKCVWVGDGRLRERFEAEILEAKLGGRVVVAGWKDTANQFLSAFDCFCLPSNYEGLPLALLEAMAASLPCVVSRVDGTQDAINHGQDGYLCPVNDVERWRETLLPLIESPELRVIIGRAAHHRFVAEFSVQAMASRTLAVYEETIQAFHAKQTAKSRLRKIDPIA